MFNEYYYTPAFNLRLHLFSLASSALISSIYRCRRPEIRRGERFSREQRGVQEYAGVKERSREREWWKAFSRSARSPQRGLVFCRVHPFILFAFRGKRNRTFVLDRGNRMVCTLLVRDHQVFERASWVTDLCLLLSHQFAGAVVFAPTCRFSLLSV